jgi:hypothetical protein
MARTLATMRVWLATLCVVALTAAGCGEEAAAPSGGDDGKLSAPLTFKLSGGDALRQDQLTLRPDGSAQVTTLAGDVPAKVTPKELSTVSDQLADADLPDIPEDSTTDPAMPDALAYSVEYRGRKVVTDSGSLPEKLEPLIGSLLKLVDRYGKH